TTAPRHSSRPSVSA
ncbi:hypothetical protein AB1N83_009836, partial [Pleurotus pulmonarius]